MEAETFAYLIKQITSAPLQTHPYSHFHIEQAFPEPFYFELIENIPDSSYFSLMDGYPQRSYINLTKEHLEHLPFPHFLFWHTFATSISTPHFINALFEKFQAPLTKRFGENLCKAKLGFDLSLVRDQSGYSIGPHTDHPQ